MNIVLPMVLFAVVIGLFADTKKPLVKVVIGLWIAAMILYRYVKGVG